jgi:hypothetical protein
MYGIKIMHAPFVGVEGQWIESFDWDAHAPGKLYPTGNGSSTDDPAKAMRFDTVEAAWEAWRKPSAVCPTRPHDGKPNRPMTVFTVSVEKLPEEER